MTRASATTSQLWTYTWVWDAALGLAPPLPCACTPACLPAMADRWRCHYGSGFIARCSALDALHCHTAAALPRCWVFARRFALWVLGTGLAWSGILPPLPRRLLPPFLRNRTDYFAFLCRAARLAHSIYTYRFFIHALLHFCTCLANYLDAHT